MSPELALADEVDEVVAAGVAAVVALLLLLLLPQAASTNAPKLAAPALPAIFRKRLRSESSRTSRSTMPAGCGTSFSVTESTGIFEPPVGVHCPSIRGQPASGSVLRLRDAAL